MAKFQADGITTFFTDLRRFDGRERPPILFISGLGSQHTAWKREFLGRFRSAGYGVFTMDNRDAGQSSQIETPVDLASVMRAVAAGQEPNVPYRLADMAADSVRLLDHLEIEAAHIVGVSMGGMIAQTIAIEHPERVLSLTSIMSTTGNPAVGGSSPIGKQALFLAPPPSREAAAETSVESRRLLATPGTFEEAVQRHEAQEAIARSYNPNGVARQFAAILASGDRTQQLGNIEVPTLVIHGTGDPLVDVSGGVATAECIPDAKLVLIDGMSHDLPIRHWPEVTRAMVSHFDAVEQPALDPRIVPASVENAGELAAIAARAFADDRERYGSGPPGLDDPATHRQLIEQGHCHEIWESGQLAGAAYVFYQGSGVWNLGSIFIDPARHRSGLGTALMRWVRRNHPWLKYFRLETPYQNTHLHRFYEGLGYWVVGTTEPGSHPESADPGFHLIKYQYDAWEDPWMPTAAEVVETATTLREDFLANEVDGMETLRDETVTVMIEQLTGWIGEMQAGPISDSSIEGTRMLMGSYARSFSGDPWESRGGSHRFTVVPRMMQKLRH